MKKLIGFLIIVCLLFNVSFCFSQVTVGFAWDANTESDLAGYKLYWDIINDDVYTNFKNVLDVKNVTTVYISSFAFNSYNKVAVTAYNTYGDESDFSEILVFYVNSKGITFVKNSKTHINSSVGYKIIK